MVTTRTKKTYGKLKKAPKKRNQKSIADFCVVSDQREHVPSYNQRPLREFTSSTPLTTDNVGISNGETYQGAAVGTPHSGGEIGN